MQVRLEGGSHSQVFIMILLDGKSREGSWLVYHDVSVGLHWSREAHDLHHLIARGLFGIL